MEGYLKRSCKKGKRKTVSVVKRIVEGVNEMVHVYVYVHVCSQQQMKFAF